jgi:hypothetical protein
MRPSKLWRIRLHHRRRRILLCTQVLTNAECELLVAEMDAVASRVGWQDDGTGVKFGTALPGHELEGELFTAEARAVVEAALLGQALPLCRELFGCPGLSVRGNSAALIRYGSGPIDATSEPEPEREPEPEPEPMAGCVGAAAAVGTARTVSQVGAPLN